MLHLEDDPRDAELIRQKLKANGLSFDIVWVNGKEAFESALERELFDVVLADYNLRDYDGMSALASIREKYPELPVIMISGGLSEEEAVDCLKAGATDYVLKQRPQRLGAAVTRALAEKAERTKRREAETALHQSEERFRSAMYFSAIGMALVAPDGRWLEVNRALCQITGYSEEELLAVDFQSITHPDDLAIDLEYVRGMLAREIDSYQLEKRYLRKDGRIVWILLGVSLLWHPNGEPRHFISQIQDITLRKQQEERIARLSRIQAVLSGINSAIIRIRDRQELFQEACRIIVEHGGFTVGWISALDHVSGKLVQIAKAGLPLDLDAGGNSPDGPVGLVPAGTAEVALRERRPAFDNDIERGLGEMNIKSGPDTLSIRRAAVRAGAKSVIVLPLFVEGKTFGVLTLYTAERNFFDDEELKLLSELAGDISFGLEFIAKEEKVDYLAYYDALTGLPNNALFLDRCNQLLRAAESEGQSVALILLDLERFRQINETLGRHAGDALLKHVAQRLNSMQLGRGGGARIGPDVFALTAPGIRSDTDAARMFEDEITPAISAPIEFEGNEYRLSAKAGIALGPADGGDAETLLQNAESALARAKRSGERRLFYEPEMNARVGERLILESRLRVALEQNQFVLHYQPKFDSYTRTITGLEALIRWADPEMGLVAPAQFIPLLEETGMILEVGCWAMEKALSDRAKWHKCGLAAPRIAVNVSAIQLRQKDFAETVREIIARHSEPSEQEGCGLDLEITESLVMEDIESNIAKLDVIRELGVGVYVDDFGTGYSSLSYIARLPINALKIDRAFVNNMTTNAYDRTIVSIIILLAHSLNLSVVAEGVETEEQFSMLGILKCDEVQGYLLSRPLPPEEVPGLWQKLT